MNWQLLHQEYAALKPEWDLKDISLTFFKCIRWQVEETMDPINCPYHYFCDSDYPGNYSPVIDILVLIFIAISYLATLVIMVMTISGKVQKGSLSKRWFLPSGPVSLPIILFVLAKGHQINTIFPLSSFGPAILQLVQISALSFDVEVAKDFKYVFFETSTISGILHASMYLDSIILPYYTGLDALVASSFSGECSSCVCRKEVLLVGGKLVSYKGWSVTTFFVVVALFWRVICRLTGEKTGRVILVRYSLESLGWILIAIDCVYLLTKSPAEKYVQNVAAFGGIFALICLHILKMACTQFLQCFHYTKHRIRVTA